MREELADLGMHPVPPEDGRSGEHWATCNVGQQRRLDWVCTTKGIFPLTEPSLTTWRVAWKTHAGILTTLQARPRTHLVRKQLVPEPIPQWKQCVQGLDLSWREARALARGWYHKVKTRRFWPEEVLAHVAERPDLSEIHARTERMQLWALTN